MDDSTHRAIAADIARMQDAFKGVVHDENHITMPQFRALKQLRHDMADFLVRITRHDNLPPKTADGE